MNKTEEIEVDFKIVGEITYEIFKLEKDNIKEKTLKRDEISEQICSIIQKEVGKNF